MDGRVITQLFNGNGQLKQTEALGACYKQLNASVGQFGTATLVASTAALASGSASDDTKYITIDRKLSTLGSQRDALATSIKNELDQAAFHGAKLDNGTAKAQLDQCNGLLVSAAQLAASATSS